MHHRTGSGCGVAFHHGILFPQTCIVFLASCKGAHWILLCGGVPRGSRQNLQGVVLCQWAQVLLSHALQVLHPVSGQIYCRITCMRLVEIRSSWTRIYKLIHAACAYSCVVGNVEVCCSVCLLYFFLQSIYYAHPYSVQKTWFISKMI